MTGIFVLVLLATGFMILRSGDRVSDDKDYTLAGRNLSGFQVSAVIIGTLVGGASTIGTVQLAYEYGIAAWLFTLGSGLACLALGAFFAVALRCHDVVTVTELMGQYFGPRFRAYSSLLTSAGMFIHVIAQYISAMAVLMAIFRLSQVQATLIVAAGFLLIVVRGGMRGSAMIGIAKVGFLYLVMVISCGLVFFRSGGVSSFLQMLPAGNWWRFTDYGNTKALTDLAFMVIGVLSTQTYLQAIFSAKSVHEAKKGAFIAAALIPPVGFLGVVIGLFLRTHHPELQADTSMALPFFITHYFNEAVSGMFLAFIFVIILGTGSGLALGVTTNLYNDFLRHAALLKRVPGIRLVRWSSFLVIAVSAGIVMLELNGRILQWSFLSMGLRGVSVFLPLSLIVFLNGRPMPAGIRRLIASPLLVYLIYVVLT